MTDVDPRAAAEPGRKRGDGGGRRPEPPKTAVRPPEDRAFIEEEPALDVVAPDPLTVGTGFEVEHELVQLSQEMIRVGRQAFNEAMSVWRQSFEPIAAARIGMGRWHEDVMRQATGFGAVRPLRAARPSVGAVAASWMGGPALDLKELPDAYRLDVEVPGLEADDLDLSLKDGLLIVSGYKAEAIDEGDYQISERRYGRFERAVPLPDAADRDRIDAALDKGVLTVTLPKKAKAIAPRRKVEIRMSSSARPA